MPPFRKTREIVCTRSVDGVKVVLQLLLNLAQHRLWGMTEKIMLGRTVSLGNLFMFAILGVVSLVLLVAFVPLPSPSDRAGFDKHQSSRGCRSYRSWRTRARHLGRQHRRHIHPCRGARCLQCPNSAPTRRTFRSHGKGIPRCFGACSLCFHRPFLRPITATCNAVHCPKLGRPLRRTAPGCSHSFFSITCG